MEGHVQMGWSQPKRAPLMADAVVPPRWVAALVEQAREAIAAFGPDGRLVYANPAADELLGHAAGTLLGTNAFDLVHPEDLARVATNIAGMADGARPLPGLIRLRRGDGEWALYEISPSPIEPGDESGPLTAVIIRDTSHQDAQWRFLTALSGGADVQHCFTVLADGLTTETDGPMGIAYDGTGGRVVAGTPRTRDGGRHRRRAPRHLPGRTVDGRRPHGPSRGRPGRRAARALASARRGHGGGRLRRGPRGRPRQHRPRAHRPVAPGRGPGRALVRGAGPPSPPGHHPRPRPPRLRSAGSSTWPTTTPSRACSTAAGSSPTWPSWRPPADPTACSTSTSTGSSR